MSRARHAQSLHPTVSRPMGCPAGEPVLLEVLELKKRVHENARDFVKPGSPPPGAMLTPMGT